MALIIDWINNGNCTNLQRLGQKTHFLINNNDILDRTGYQDRDQGRFRKRRSRRYLSCWRSRSIIAATVYSRLLYRVTAEWTTITSVSRTQRMMPGVVVYPSTPLLLSTQQLVADPPKNNDSHHQNYHAPFSRNTRTTSHTTSETAQQVQQ